MTTPTGAAVSNSFRIIRGAEFKVAIEKHFSNVVVTDETDTGTDAELGLGELRVSLHASDGYWPTESEQIDGFESFFEFVSDYVAGGELAILHSTSVQGPADVRFQSVSIAEGCKIRSIELEQVEAVHQLAQAM